MSNTEVHKHPKYIGVYENKTSNYNPYKATWVAKMTVNGKVYSLIFTENAEKAARAYDNWAKYYHKDKAVLNFPDFIE